VKKYRIWGSLLLAAFLLAACSAGGQEPKEPSALEKTVLIYATTNPEGIDRENILRFNDSHTGISIEVKDYSQTSSMGKTGWNRLVTDMITGNSPDIIDLGDGLPKSSITNTYARFITSNSCYYKRTYF